MSLCSLPPTVATVDDVLLVLVMVVAVRRLSLLPEFNCHATYFQSWHYPLRPRIGVGNSVVGVLGVVEPDVVCILAGTTVNNRLATGVNALSEKGAAHPFEQT